MSLAEIAGAEQVPAGYLEQLAMPLRRAGLIEGTRGAHGGYQLARPPLESDGGRRDAGARRTGRARRVPGLLEYVAGLVRARIGCPVALGLAATEGERGPRSWTRSRSQTCALSPAADAVPACVAIEMLAPLRPGQRASSPA